MGETDARVKTHSIGIEGNTLSYAETYAILFNDNEFQVSADQEKYMG